MQALEFLQWAATHYILNYPDLKYSELCLGCVPDEMKTARVIPLYKKKSKTDPGNYRPVSILTIVSIFFRKGYIQSN